MHRRWTFAVGWVALVALPGMMSHPAGAAPPPWVNGAAALARLGPRLDEVAARHDLSPGQLRSNLVHDQSLYVDTGEQLLYIDAPTPMEAQAQAATTTAATIDPSTALTLHSRPGSRRVIYLDFDGQTISGTGWNTSTGGTCSADPYDGDGNPSFFSSDELTAIAGVWSRVAEDFATMDVDVTTADPGADAINRSSSLDANYGTRVVITNSTSTCPNGKTLYASVCSGGCGGVSYVGMFDQTPNHDYYQPSFVFVNGVGSSEKLVAEAASHETGHTGGLSHDGTSTSPYYWGQGSWAPIMGAAYYEPITQWSKGEYADANQTQDDFGVMQSNGLQQVADDYPERSPAALAANAPRTGVISNRSDVDVFAITLKSATTITVTATPAAASPDLDIGLTLRNSKGKTIASADPPSATTSEDIASGMDAHITIALTAGTYTARVDGVGAGDPLTTGYSDYGSVGGYTLTMTTGT